MKFENTKRDILVVHDNKGAAQLVVPGTGVRAVGIKPPSENAKGERLFKAADAPAEQGQFYVGELEVPDDKLEPLMGDLSKFLHAGYLKCAAADLEILKASNLLQPKQV